MSLFSIVVLAIALSMDAFSASICEGTVLKRVTWKEVGIVGLWFGIFQGGMAFLGYFLGSTFAQMVSAFSGVLAFGLLGWIGGKMVYEALKDEPGQGFSLKAKHMFPLAIATSIDALACGVTFSIKPVQLGFSSVFSNIALGCIIISFVTTILCMAGVKLGHVIGQAAGKWAQVAGGIVLCILGVKMLF